MDFSQRRRVDARQRPTTATQPSVEHPVPRSRQTHARRHAGIFEAIHRLDARLDASSREELARWIADQYADDFGGVPVGFVALCHLGPPYVDHRLDMQYSIVEHYSAAQEMPEPFAQARMLVRTGAYAFVEVFANGELRPVLADGSVVI